MPVNASDDMTVALKDGPAVSIRSIKAALALEAQGCTMRVDTDGGLIIEPATSVPAGWVETLRTLKADLVQITRYVGDTK